MDDEIAFTDLGSLTVIAAAMRGCLGPTLSVLDETECIPHIVLRKAGVGDCVLTCVDAIALYDEEKDVWHGEHCPILPVETILESLQLHGSRPGNAPSTKVGLVRLRNGLAPAKPTPRVYAGRDPGDAAFLASALLEQGSSRVH